MNKNGKMKKVALAGLVCSCAFVAGVCGLNTINGSAADAAKMSFDEKCASVRTNSATMGIRFQANYDASLYEKVENGGEVGMIIVPAQAIATWDQANEDLFSDLKNTYGKTKAEVSTQFVTSQFEEKTGGGYIAKGAIVSIQDENLGYDYQAVAYYKEGETYCYSAPSAPKSFSYVINQALASEEETDPVAVLKTAATLSNRLLENGLSLTEVTTTAFDTIDITDYSANGYEVQSVTLGEQELTVADELVLSGANVSDSAQVLTLTYSDSATLKFNVKVEKKAFTITDRTDLAAFDKEAYYTSYVAGEDIRTYYEDSDVFEIESGTVQTVKSATFTNDTLNYSLLKEEKTLVKGADSIVLDHTYATTVQTKKSDFRNYGTGTFTIETDAATYTYPNAGVYTMVLETAKDVQNWLNISVAFYGKDGTYGADGYFVLGNNITADETVTVGADGCWNYTPQILTNEWPWIAHKNGYMGSNSGQVGYRGVFDGRGYSIDKMDITVDDTYTTQYAKGAAFIPVLTGTIKNTAFTNCKFTANTSWEITDKTAELAVSRTGFVVADICGVMQDLYVDVTYDTDKASMKYYETGVLSCDWQHQYNDNVKIERCITKVAKTDKVSWGYTTYFGGAIFHMGSNTPSGGTPTINDVFCVNWVKMSNQWSRDMESSSKGDLSAYIGRWAGFENADNMAYYAGETLTDGALASYSTTTGFNYKKNFVDDVTGSVWSIDAKGLPYFTSLGATPYTYSA